MKQIFKHINLIFLLMVYSTASAYSDVKLKVSDSIEKFYSTHKVQAVYAFAENHQIIEHGAHGFYDLSQNKRLSVYEKMPIASGTKVFTAAAIFKLQDKGMLNINDSIAKHLTVASGVWEEGKIPNWASKVKIKNLLNHSSGLPEYVFTFKIDLNKDQEQVNKDILAFVAKQDLKFKPGSQADYNNTGYMILSRIIEQVSGQKFEDFMKKEIFEPNQMHNTRIASFKEAIEFQKGKSHIVPARYYEIPNNTPTPIFKPVGAEIIVAPNGDGGAISNTEDLIKWNEALHSGKVISKASYKQMTKKQFKNKSSGGYKTYIGNGIYISEMKGGDVVYHHEGRALGIRSDNGYMPSHKVSYAIISNAMLYIPNEMEGKIDMTKPENQVDILYLRNAVLGFISQQP